MSEVFLKPCLLIMIKASSNVSARCKEQMPVPLQVVYTLPCCSLSLFEFFLFVLHLPEDSMWSH